MLESSPQSKSTDRLDLVEVIGSRRNKGSSRQGSSYHENGFVMKSVGLTQLLSCCDVPSAMLGCGK